MFLYNALPETLVNRSFLASLFRKENIEDPFGVLRNRFAQCRLEVKFPVKLWVCWPFKRALYNSSFFGWAEVKICVVCREEVRDCSEIQILLNVNNQPALRYSFTPIRLS